MNAPSLEDSVSRILLWGTVGTLLCLFLEPAATSAAIGLGLGVVAYLVAERRAWFNRESWRRQFAWRCRISDALVIVGLLSLTALAASVWGRGDLGMTAVVFVGALPYPALLTMRELRFLTERGVDDGILRGRLLIGAFLLVPAHLIVASVLLSVADAGSKDVDSGTAIAAIVAGAVVIAQYALDRRTANRLGRAPRLAITERDLPPRNPPPAPTPFRWP